MTSSPASTARIVDHPAEQMHHNLAATVESVLWAYSPLRQSNSTVAVSADNGVVTLAGNVLSTTMKNIAGLLVLQVPEVTAVVNNLRPDPDIERDVAMALAFDTETQLYTDTMAIKCLRGSLYLGGVVRAPKLELAEAMIARAEELAAGIEGVREVLSGAKAAVSIGAEAGAASPAADTDEATAAENEAMSERLSVWRERAASAG